MFFLNPSSHQTPSSEGQYCQFIYFWAKSSIVPHLELYLLPCTQPHADPAAFPSLSDPLRPLLTARALGQVQSLPSSSSSHAQPGLPILPGHSADYHTKQSWNPLPPSSPGFSLPFTLNQLQESSLAFIFNFKPAPGVLPQLECLCSECMPSTELCDSQALIESWEGDLFYRMEIGTRGG